MALLKNITLGDDEPADRDVEVEPDPVPCSLCGVPHVGGYCVEPGEHVVCVCGQTHERDYCPTEAGHGALL